MNNMSFRKIILLFLSVAVCGCSVERGNVYREYVGFNEKRSVQAVKVEIPPVLLYPRALYLIDGKLIVFNEKTDTLFQMFSVPELHYLNQFGIRGKVLRILIYLPTMLLVVT